MKNIIFTLLLFLSIGTVAQNEITGIVVNETDNTLRYEVIFNTSEASKAYVAYTYLETDGELVTKYSGISEQGTSHAIKVVGLLSNTVYSYDIHAFNETGAISSETSIFTTGNIPMEVNLIDSLGTQSGDGLDGYILTNGITIGTGNPGVAQIFDRQGRVRWYEFFPGEVSEQRCHQFTFSPDQTIFYTNCHGMVEQRLDGSIVADVDLTAYDSLYLHHEAFKNQDGNYVAIYSNTRIIDKTSVGGPPDALIVGQGFIEFTPEGELLQQWSCFDHYDPLTSPEPGGFWTPIFGQESANWLHANAMTQDIDGHYIMSFRFANHLIKIHKDNGLILWTLGDNGNIDFDSPSNRFVGQHDIHLNNDGNYMLFDNQGLDSLSRVMEFWIDLEYDPFMTMELWEYVLPQELFSSIVSSSERLDNGNTLICSGTGQSIFEVTPDKEIVWFAHQNSRPYRAYYVADFYESVTIDFANVAETVCIGDGAFTPDIQPVGGYMEGTGIVDNIFDPALAGVGEHEIVYHYGYVTDTVTLMVSNVGECSTGLDSPPQNVCHLYPNPTNNVFNLQYEVAGYSRVMIDVLDTKGRLVQSLVNQEEDNGVYVKSFDKGALNLSAGTYLLRLAIGDNTYFEKVVVF